MGAALQDATGVHHQNFMRVHHSTKAVRNHQRGLVLRHALQLGLNRALVGAVERRGRFVLNQHSRIFQQGAGNRHALLFTTG